MLKTVGRISTCLKISRLLELDSFTCFLFSGQILKCDMNMINKPYEMNLDE
jgi:hypothetical protein